MSFEQHVWSCGGSVVSIVFDVCVCDMDCVCECVHAMLISVCMSMCCSVHVSQCAAWWCFMSCACVFGCGVLGHLHGCNESEGMCT